MNSNNYIESLPEEIFRQILLNLPFSRLYRLRRISPYWNRICSSILEDLSWVCFFNWREINNFINEMPNQRVFDTHPQVCMFEADINDILSEGESRPTLANIASRFSEFCNAMQLFNAAWGHMVRYWDCDLQVKYYHGVSAPDLFQESINYILYYFQNLQHLELRLPMVQLATAPSLDDHIAISRSELKTLTININHYRGSSAATSGFYIHSMIGVLATLLSNVTQLERLEITAGYFRPNIAINGILANAATLSSTLTTLVLTPKVSNDELAQLAIFNKLKKVELCVDPQDVNQHTVAHFLSSCATTLQHLTFRFLLPIDINGPVQENPIKIFPSVHLSNLDYLKVGGYEDGHVKLCLLPNLTKLRLCQSKNLKITMSNIIRASFGKSPLLTIAGLRELYLADYAQRSSLRNQVPTRLLLSTLRIISFDCCDFSAHQQILGKIFSTCAKLETLHINQCEGLSLSDAAFCDTGNNDAEEYEQFITRLMDERADDEELRLAASAYDTSNLNPHQISNLKALKSLAINGVANSPLSDAMVLFGLSHCSSLIEIKLEVETQFSVKSRRMLQLMLPKLDICKLNFCEQ